MLRVILFDVEKCFKITSSYVLEDFVFNSNQIEADTKIALHCNHALQNVSGLVVVQSSPGDVDIMIILLQLMSSPERKSSLIPDVALPDYTSYGWNEDFSIF